MNPFEKIAPYVARTLDIAAEAETRLKMGYEML